MRHDRAAKARNTRDLRFPQHGCAMPPTASAMGPRPMRIMSTIMVNEL
jgi:hypothetical protein